MIPRIYILNLPYKRDRRERLLAHLSELGLFPADRIRWVKALSGDLGQRGAHAPLRAFRCAPRLTYRERAAHFLSPGRVGALRRECGFAVCCQVARGGADDYMRGRLCSPIRLYDADAVHYPAAL